MKIIYSPQLKEVFTVKEENDSAYITKEGAYLSKKMAKCVTLGIDPYLKFSVETPVDKYKKMLEEEGVEEIKYGEYTVSLKRFDKFDAPPCQFPKPKIDLDIPDWLKDLEFDPILGVKDKSGEWSSIKNIKEELFGVDHCVNQNFYD